jgi:hypothetical protein
MGLGKPDPECTCTHFGGAMTGKKLNIIAKENPTCPVHRKDKKPV